MNTDRLTAAGEACTQGAAEGTEERYAGGDQPALMPGDRPLC